MKAFEHIPIKIIENMQKRIEMLFEEKYLTRDNYDNTMVVNHYLNDFFNDEPNTTETNCYLIIEKYYNGWAELVKQEYERRFKDSYGDSSDETKEEETPIAFCPTTQPPAFIPPSHQLKSFLLKDIFSFVPLSTYYTDNDTFRHTEFYLNPLLAPYSIYIKFCKTEGVKNNLKVKPFKFRDCAIDRFAGLTDDCKLIVHYVDKSNLRDDTLRFILTLKPDSNLKFENRKDFLAFIPLFTSYLNFYIKLNQLTGQSDEFFNPLNLESLQLSTIPTIGPLFKPLAGFIPSFTINTNEWNSLIQHLNQ